MILCGKSEGRASARLARTISHAKDLKKKKGKRGGRTQRRRG